MQSKKTRNDSVVLLLRAIIPEADKDGEYSAERFVDLTVKEGDTYRPLFEPTMKTMNELLELARMFTEWGVKETYNYLVETVIPQLQEMYEAGQTERYSVLIFNSPLLENERKNEEVMLAKNADQGPLTDIASCKKCGELKVRRIIAQTRKADEGATSIFTCPKCGFQWFEN